MELPSKNSLAGDQVYLIYNALKIFILIGRQADPFYVQQIYKVPELAQLNMSMSEEEMFADVEQSTYLTNLYSIIN